MGHKGLPAGGEDAAFLISIKTPVLLWTLRVGSWKTSISHCVTLVQTLSASGYAELSCECLHTS